MLRRRHTDTSNLETLILKPDANRRVAISVAGSQAVSPTREDSLV